MIGRWLRGRRNRKVAQDLMSKLRAGSDAFRGATLTDIWRISRTKTILRIGSGGETRLALFFHRNDPAEVAENVFFAHENLSVHLADMPGMGVPRAVAVLPEAGCVVTEFIDAPDLQSLLTRGTAGDGVTRAARWLSALHGAFPGRPGTCDFGEIAQAVERDLVSRNLPSPIRQLREGFMARAAELDRHQTSFVKFHKDFAPRNVLIGADMTWAVDLTNTRWRMPEMDLAHFLLEASIDMGDTGTRGRWGLPPALLDQVQAGYGLEERDLEFIPPHLCALILRQWAQAAGTNSRTARHRAPLLKAMAEGFAFD
ncbi:MAG: phosphotransferase [Pseudomonadota bacterium]